MSSAEAPNTLAKPSSRRRKASILVSNNLLPPVLEPLQDPKRDNSDKKCRVQLLMSGDGRDRWRLTAVPSDQTKYNLGLLENIVCSTLYFGRSLNKITTTTKGQILLPPFKHAICLANCMKCLNSRILANMLMVT